MTAIFARVLYVSLAITLGALIIVAFFSPPAQAAATTAPHDFPVRDRDSESPGTKP